MIKLIITSLAVCLVSACSTTPASGNKLVKFSHYDGVKVCTYKVKGKLVHINQKNIKVTGTKCPKYL